MSLQDVLCQTDVGEMGYIKLLKQKKIYPFDKKTETVATITYQNFFLLYPKLSGMTGTGKTAEIEFEKIYNLSVEVIPTAKSNQRIDLPDLIYKDQFAKWYAIAKTCNQISQTNQPILIGTTTVEKSEMVAQLLSEYNLRYQLLNAKPQNVRRESEIVAQAGQERTITIATNMAGRGTDIILGGNINFPIQKELYDILTLSKNYLLSKKLNLFESPVKQYFNSTSYKVLTVIVSLLKNKKFLQLSDVDILRILKENDRVSSPKTNYYCSIRFLINQLNSYYQKQQNQRNRIVKNLGGLYIIGTERNDSRRVDNQLRGRCGRQGDPGISRFFLSLDDNLLRLFGSPKIQNLIKGQMIDNTPLESKFLTKSLDSAQNRVEERAYQQRKNLFDYDEILNFQRKIVYFERELILNSVSPQQTILGYAEQVITNFLLLGEQKFQLNQVIFLFQIFFGKPLTIKDSKIANQRMNKAKYNKLKRYFFDEFWLKYSAKKAELTIYEYGVCENFERSLILINIDQIWREHLRKMDILREAVGWRGYGQKNPLYEYKKDAYTLFQTRNSQLREIIIYNLLRSVIL
mmetsp:Transcript_24774/g.68944  ORF Transcript_24774/g.68944 Transcript_24774/m.68944 type:complete len:575 (+) Transcript_24774:1563-3287(+)